MKRQQSEHDACHAAKADLFRQLLIRYGAEPVLNRFAPDRRGRDGQVQGERGRPAAIYKKRHDVWHDVSQHSRLLEWSSTRIECFA